MKTVWLVGIDGLSEDDKLILNRARKIHKFLSQPLATFELFSGVKGKLVSLDKTIEGFEGNLMIM